MKNLVEIRYGVYLGSVLCLYTIFMWLTSLDSLYLSMGHNFDIAVIILPLLFTFLAIREKSKKTKLTILKRIQYGLTVNFISYLIHTPFLMFYHHIINPDWMKYVLELKEKELFAQHSEPGEIVKQLETVQQMSSDMNLITNGFFVGVVVFGIVFSLLTLPFWSRRN